VLSVYRMSIHGQAAAQGIKEAPVCTSCHGEHTIRPMADRSSLVWRGAVTKTCSGCHAQERLARKFGLPLDRLASYRDTYHGLASQRGDVRVANCASCHGFHDVLPSSDPRSSIHRANLAGTCGRCHPGAGSRLAKGWIHGPPTRKHWSLQLARWFYLIMIPLTIGGMVLHNLFDLVRKAQRPPALPAGTPEGLRLTAGERWQHGVNLVCFVALAYSGFALKYPDSAWLALLAPLGEAGRRGLHRWAALAFCLLAVYHLGYLALAARGRMILRELLPGPGDVREVLARLRYYLGLGPAPRSGHGHFHYAEKVEYWSLVWGSFVMVATGVILIFNNVALRYFEPWLPDLATIIHFYEAILACSAIFVWHFYLVIFDPDVYPMNMAWLTGRVRRVGRPASKSGNRK
jgi:cytochrome b subunit of formate dehydrogenase